MQDISRYYQLIRTLICHVFVKSGNQHNIIWLKGFLQQVRMSKSSDKNIFITSREQKGLIFEN